MMIPFGSAGSVHRTSTMFGAGFTTSRNRGGDGPSGIKSGLIKGSDKCTIGIYAALYIKAPVYNALVQFIHMGVARTYLLNCA